MKTIFLLTGWGIGSKPLQPLARALEVYNYNVILADLPYQTTEDEWLECIANQLPEQSYWIGWSLGGQLLSYLTKGQGKQCLSLITLGANPCFVERSDWSSAMANGTFDHFQAAYHQAPEQTLKRFLRLISQGCPDARQLLKALQAGFECKDVIASEIGLQLLACIDARQALQSYQGRQLHLLAEFDALVPVACADALRRMLPNATVDVLASMGHGFAVQNTEYLAEHIHHFIHAGC